jgi:hypothetical protein
MMTTTNKPVFPALAVLLLALLVGHASPVATATAIATADKSAFHLTYEDMSSSPELRRLIDEAMTLLEPVVRTWHLLVAGPTSSNAR